MTDRGKGRALRNASAAELQRHLAAARRVVGVKAGGPPTDPARISKAWKVHREFHRRLKAAGIYVEGA